MSSDPGRNQPCPCGSGAKYKNCCMGTENWYEQWGLSSLALTLILLAALVLGAMAFFGDSGGGQPDCPPGQVWSEAHGHCH